MKSRKHRNKQSRKITGGKVITAGKVITTAGKVITTAGKVMTASKTLKRRTCNPAIKNTLDHSCFTPKALNILKDAYNQKHNSSQQITTKNPKEIWQKLNQKIPHCDQETCWLQEIPDKSLQEKMKKELFAPEQPKEWKSKPNAWLSNFDIDAVIEQYEQAHDDFLFLGPSPIDFDTIKNGKCVWEDLCRLSLVDEYKKGKRKFGVVFNLDTSEGSGTHWVSLFIDVGCDTPFIFYFNSTSEKMPPEVEHFITRMKTQWLNYKNEELSVFQNLNVEHQNSNTECGMYSLFFVITCLTRKVNEKKLSTKDLVNLFAGKHRIPDKYVEKYRGIYFNA